MAVDSGTKKSDNSNSYFVIEGEGMQLKVNKRDLQFKSTGGHTHQYLPDFSDEWEGAIALECAVKGCIHGMMMKKEGKGFMDWLEGHRAKA